MDIERLDANRKFFSAKAISWGTYLGGPLAGTYYVWKNFKTQGEYQKARMALVFGVLFSILIGYLASMNNEFIEKVPSPVIPVIYSAIATLVTYYWSKDQIDTHEKDGFPFFKWYQTLGVAIVGLVLFVVPLFYFLTGGNFQIADLSYESKLTEINQCEIKALKIYEYDIEVGNNEAIEYLENVSLPEMKKAEALLKKVADKKLSSSYSLHRSAISEYVMLRIKTFEVMKLFIATGSESVLDELYTLEKKIDVSLDNIDKIVDE